MIRETFWSVGSRICLPVACRTKRVDKIVVAGSTGTNAQHHGRQVKRLAHLALVICMLIPLLLISVDVIGQKATPGKVYVVLWFDTEDYILPQSDDAAKRLATFLTEQGIQATFKVVGEKARTLERRHRTDVIAALQKHAIGYHSNTHSQHPTPAEYESLLNWESGAA